jgi:carboxypeptidase C (cathepsin A)
MIPVIARRLFILALGLLGVVALPQTVLAAGIPAYTAKAGMLNIGQDPARPDAEIFHIAYTAKGADPAKRPVTFVFNGGPGAASIYLHMSAIGPKVLASAGDGSFPSAPARLTDNPDSWLRFTDLVFIDPVGAGYSRMLPGPDGKPGDPKAYYEVVGDADAFAMFIRNWLTANNRWSSPKAIAGESYGGRRAAVLTNALAISYSINLNRVILMSPEFRMVVADDRYSLIHPMTLLPSQVAIASFHGLSTGSRDEAGLQAAEDYAMSGFVTGLASLGEATPEQRNAFYTKVGGMIGIDPAIVARHNGRVLESVFSASLLSSRGLVIDSYDGSQISDNPTPESESLGVFDRSVSQLTGILLPPFIGYVRNTLGYNTDRPYIVLNLEANGGWDRSATAGGPEDFAIALAQNHDLKLFVANGIYDLGSNYLMPRYLLRQTVHGEDARARMSFQTYEGGHMFYLRTKSRAQLTTDVQRNFEEAPGGQR